MRQPALGKNSTIHQVITMLATSKNVLFPDHNYLLTDVADDPTLSLLLELQREMASMVVTWWMVAFCVVQW